MDKNITKSQARYVIENREIWFVPFVNPDSYIANQAKSECVSRPCARNPVTSKISKHIRGAGFKVVTTQNQKHNCSAVKGSLENGLLCAAQLRQAKLYPAYLLLLADEPSVGIECAGSLLPPPLSNFLHGRRTLCKDRACRSAVAVAPCQI